MLVARSRKRLRPVHRAPRLRPIQLSSLCAESGLTGVGVVQRSWREDDLTIIETSGIIATRILTNSSTLILREEWQVEKIDRILNDRKPSGQDCLSRPTDRSDNT